MRVRVPRRAGIESGARRAGWRGGLAIGCLGVALVASTVPPANASAEHTTRSTTWQPESATYDVSQPEGQFVRMADGTKLWTETFYPTVPATGKRASGKFPVLLAQDPYGSPTQNLGSGDYYIQHGYIYVVAELRGTGKSGGQRSWFGTQMGKDGAQLVKFAAKNLSGSNGRVGLDGCSYLGVDQWFTAAAVGAHSALKAIAPFCTDSNFYDDLTASGGIPTTFAMGIGHAEPVGPEDNPATDPLSVTVSELANGGPAAFNGTYWKSVDVADTLMPHVVANGVPAISETGWNDLYPGGNLDDYVTAQNAYFGRPLRQPISAHARVTGRYQAIVGDWAHGENTSGPELNAIKLEWFDTWLKGAATGMASTSTPLHLWERGADQWVDSAAYPLTLDAQRRYLSGSGTLTQKAPKTTSAADQMKWAVPSTSSPGTIGTYTSTPLTRAAVLDGPTDMTVFAASTTPDLELTATLNVVNSSGTVTKLASGDLLGSQRAVDVHKSWMGSDGSYLRPVHPFGESDQRMLTARRTYEFDLSLSPILERVPAGDSLQIVLTTQAPADLLTGRSLVPTPEDVAALTGGVYQIERNSRAASFANLPLAPASEFTKSRISWGPAS
jgi:predicted acyl esterase